MGRAQWGGGSDYSGVFASMANQLQNNMDTLASQALARAKRDSEAAAQEMYNKWKNGLISDSEWLDFLRGKVAESVGDPEEHQRWADALRDHEGSIEDAQMEAKYSAGSITLAALMSYYHTKMGTVETDSPKWREYAARYAQIQEAVRAGSGGGGRGGSSGGGSARGIAAGQRAAQGGPSGNPNGLAYDVAGEDILNPANALIGYRDGDDYLTNLFTDVKRIADMMNWIKENPGATEYYDPYTGVIQLTPEMLAETDRQYLRTEDQIIAYGEAQGTPDGLQNAVEARAAKTKYIAGTMQQHNQENVQPVFDALQQQTIENLVAIGLEPDPQKRLGMIRGLATPWSALTDGTLDGMGGRGLQEAYMGDITTRVPEAADDRGGTSTLHWTMGLPPELAVQGDIFRRSEAWPNFLHDITNPALDETSTNLLISRFLDVVTGETGIDKGLLTTLLTGSAGGDGEPPVVGILETMDQVRAVTQGGMDPNSDYPGQRYTYVNEGGVVRMVAAETRQVAHNGAAPSLELVPEGRDETSFIRYATKIGGKIVQVYGEALPLDLPGMSAYRLTANVDIGGITYKSGTFLDSSVIAENGGIRFVNQMIANQSLQKESMVQVLDLPDGTRWFIDPDTGLGSRDLPAAGLDAVTGGVLVVDGRPSQMFSNSGGDVFMPSDGTVSGQAMQAYIEGQIAAGHIVPSDYGRRNAGGEVDANHLWTDEEIGHQYWSVKDQRGQSKRNARARAAQLRSEENDSFVKDFVREQVMPRDAQSRVLEGTDPFTKIKSVGESMGISFDSQVGQDRTPAAEQPPTDIREAPYYGYPREFNWLNPGDPALAMREQPAREIAATKKANMLTIKPSLAKIEVADVQRAPLPIPPVPATPIATARTYAQQREGGQRTPPIVPRTVTPRTAASRVLESVD